MASGPKRAERFPAATAAAAARSVSRLALRPRSNVWPLSGAGTHAATSAPFHETGTSCPLYTYPSETPPIYGRIRGDPSVNPLF